MIKMVKVVEVEPVGPWQLRIRFSDGSEGVRDFSAMIAEGGEMVEPLKDRVFFDRVHVEYGVPTWPNGFDLDAINRYMELRDAGALTRHAAE